MPVVEMIDLWQHHLQLVHNISGLGMEGSEVKNASRMKDILTRTDRRVAILDIEASALGIRSYPIEVGVALVEGARKPIKTGARIVCPTPSWRKSGTWSPASEAVHGLSVETLNQHGHDPSEVCDWLNALLG